MRIEEPEQLDGEKAAGVELEALEAVEAAWRSIMDELVNWRAPRTEFILGHLGFLVQGGENPGIITLRAAQVAAAAEQILRDEDQDGPGIELM